MARTAQQAATEVLESVYGSIDTISLPIDPIVVARELGLNVYEARLENQVSGVISRLSGPDVDVFLNSEHAPVRQRFTLAHELGHYVRHVEQFGPEAPMYYKRDALAACGINADEIYANGFAAQLLMPATLVRLYAPSEDEFALARRFRVSLAAMELRLKNLGVQPLE